MRKPPHLELDVHICEISTAIVIRASGRLVVPGTQYIPADRTEALGAASAGHDRPAILAGTAVIVTSAHDRTILPVAGPRSRRSRRHRRSRSAGRPPHRSHR